MKELVRKVITGPIKDGLFVQPQQWTAEDEIQEQHLRDTFAQVSQYADRWTGNTRTFDPTGNYLCGNCNKLDVTKPGQCLAVEGPISISHGSSRHWENKCAGDPEILMPQKISQEMATYGTTKGPGFGCKRCRFSEPATAPDSMGRDTFCGRGRMRVDKNACCALNEPSKDNGPKHPLE